MQKKQTKIIIHGGVVFSKTVVVMVRFLETFVEDFHLVDTVV